MQRTVEEARDTTTPSVGAQGGADDADDALRLVGVTKRFPGVRALSEVSLSVRAGEVHALVGENGSGKSTLVKVASGVLRPDSGSVFIAGSEMTRATPRAARRLGVYAAFQDTALVPELTVLENLLLSFTDERGFSGRLKRQYASELLAQFEFPGRPDATVGTLSPGVRQLLEVIRALIREPKVLLLDEPTAALDAENIGRLERYIAEGRSRATAILYISHRLDEVERFADRVTVIRDSAIQGTYDGGQWSVDEIVSLMVGAPIDLTFPAKSQNPADAPDVLSTRGFSGPGFGPVDIRVREGEIVGIAGAEGNGQRELVRALVGLLPSTGEIEVDGHGVQLRSPAQALHCGMSFQSGDRAAEAVFAEMSAMNNSTFPALELIGPAGFIRRKREKSLFRRVAGDLGVVAASPDQPVAQLSGGNQQKIVLSRTLVKAARLVVVDGPTQGVDAKARLDIYEALRDHARSGRGVLVNSSDSLELAGLCDRVYVVSRGVVADELSGAELEERAIVRSFVSAKVRRPDREQRRGWEVLERLKAFIARPRVPLLILTLLTIAVGAYSAANSSYFLTSENVNALFLLTLPLALVAIGQQAALLTRGFDISVGAMMSVAVVIASFYATASSSLGILPGILLALAAGAVVGLLNGFVVRVLKVDPLIATIGMMGVLTGTALIARPLPGGAVSDRLGSIMFYSVSFMPVGLVVLAIGAAALQFVLERTGLGLNVRATGFNEEAGRRTGVRVNGIKISAFVFCSVFAAIAGLALAAQVQVGDANVGSSYALLSIAACVIGGASVGGGRGDFLGCVVASLFLSLLYNASPLLHWAGSVANLVTGVLTILAVLAYSVSTRVRDSS